MVWVGPPLKRCNQSMSSWNKSRIEVQPLIEVEPLKIIMSRSKYKTIKAHFKEHDPTLYATMDGLDFADWMHSRADLDHFESLCGSIISQQLATNAARAIKSRFIDLFPNQKINANAVLKLTDQEIRDIGVSWAKIKYIKDLAQKHKDEDIDLQNIDKLSDQEVIEELTKVKGVGPWTAEMFLIFSLGREDVFSFGDLGLKRGLEKIYGLEKPDRDEIEEIVNKWSPYRSYGSIALWHSLDGN